MNQDQKQQFQVTLDKVYKKVFGGKCGSQRYSEKTEEFKQGITTSLWEIDKFATLGRTKKEISEKLLEEDQSYLQLEIYKANGDAGWAITEESDYYFFISPKQIYKVRSCWLYMLSFVIREFIDEDKKIQEWIGKLTKSSSKQVKFIRNFGVPSLPTEFDIELKYDKGRVLANIDWKQCIKLKMDIEKIKI